MATETKAQHTPGPWKIVAAGWPNGAPCWEIHHGDDGEVVCTVEGRDQTGDAHAIAAVPDLLQALKEAEAGLEFAISTIAGKAPDADWPESSPRKALAVVQDALAKAEVAT